MCSWLVCLQGKIEFGVINQSQSAFNHVLSDLSLVVYQVCATAVSHGSLYRTRCQADQCCVLSQCFLVSARRITNGRA
jgi:hypothetical protein